MATQGAVLAEKIVAPSKTELHEWQVDIRHRKGSVGGVSQILPTLWQIRPTTSDELRKSAVRHFLRTELSVKSPLVRVLDEEVPDLRFYLLATKIRVGFFAGCFWIVSLSYMIGEDQLFVGHVGDRKLWSALGKVNLVIWGEKVSHGSVAEVLRAA